MKSVSRRTFKVISALAAVCVFQVYVLAGASAPNSLVLGRLMLAGTESILVNGNSANSGTTIISGSQLQTPADVNATVQLGTAGKLYIQPSTNLTVTFDKTNVNVKVTEGTAFVATNAGVKSSVTTPDGMTTTGDPAAPPVPDDTDDPGAVVAAAAVGIGVLAVILYFILTDDDSPS
jgi:hypothetical protein